MNDKKEINKLLDVLNKFIDIDKNLRDEIYWAYKNGAKAFVYNPQYYYNDIPALHFFDKEDYEYYRDVEERWDCLIEHIFAIQFDGDYTSFFTPWYYVDFKKVLVEEFKGTYHCSVTNLKSNTKKDLLLPDF